MAGRYQHRTGRLATQVGHVVRELAGRAGARVLAGLGVGVSRHTALRTLLRLPVPDRPVSTVIGVDDFALCQRQRYATVIIDAVTGERVDVLADRTATPYLLITLVSGASAGPALLGCGGLRVPRAHVWPAGSRTCRRLFRRSGVAAARPGRENFQTFPT